AAALSAELLFGRDHERELASRGDEDELGLAAFGLLQDISAALHARGVGVDAAIEGREVLPREDEDGGSVVFEGGLPSLARLVRVAGADRHKVRDGPERGEMLDGLMRRTILAEPDG